MDRRFSYRTVVTLVALAGLVVGSTLLLPVFRGDDHHGTGPRQADGVRAESEIVRGENAATEAAAAPLRELRPRHKAKAADQRECSLSSCTAAGAGTWS